MIQQAKIPALEFRNKTTKTYDNLLSLPDLSFSYMVFPFLSTNWLSNQRFSQQN